jgi:hypothetical protein
MVARVLRCAWDRWYLRCHVCRKQGEDNGKEDSQLPVSKPCVLKAIG